MSLDEKLAHNAITFSADDHSEFEEGKHYISLEYVHFLFGDVLNDDYESRIIDFDEEEVV